MGFLKSKVGIAVVAFLVIAIVGVIVYLMAPQLLGMSGNQSTEPTPQKKYTATFALKDRDLNLKTTGPLRYIKIGITIEFYVEKDISQLKGAELKHAQDEINAEMNPYVPLLQDAVTTIVSTKTQEELTDPKGKELLRQELIHKFESILKGHEISNIYFTEFAIQ